MWRKSPSFLDPALCARVPHPGLILNDPVCMAIALDPTVVTRQGKFRGDAETRREFTRGMRVVDARNVGTQAGFTEEWQVREPNALVCFEVGPARWKEMLFACLG